MNKILLVFLISLAPFSAYSKSTSYFHGQRFKAEITYDCEEGNLTCDKIYLQSTKIKDIPVILQVAGRAASACYWFGRGIRTYILHLEVF